jgi:hypothetical protein
MFSDKGSVHSLWQEIALNFYPKRANFTTQRDDGEEYSDHLFTSYPSMARRELGNMLDEYLFPDKFFSIHVDDEDLDEGDQERAFLERLTEIQWRAMIDPVAHLITARGQTNHDFVTFGNGVLRVSLNGAGDALLFRNYHLRDNAWGENAEGKIDHNHRNWNPTAWQLEQHFPKTVSTEVRKAREKDPYKTFECRHVVMPSRLYDHKTKSGKRFPFISLYVERESETVLEEVGMTHFQYVIPRWQIVSGSVYATSMATDVLLPDGRTVQVVMRTLREAGEMNVNPPMLAFTDAIRGDIAMYPGGITTSDIEYDGKLADVLRPVTRDKSGFPIGLDIATALKEDIRSGFLLDKIQLPEINHQMTATEVRRRYAEYIRAAAPISKPIHLTYNNPLCDVPFQLLRENGAFPFDAMPETLAEKDIKFKFRSPLDELQEQNEAELYLDIRDRILAPAAMVDPSLWEIADMPAATRAAMTAAGWKQKWFKPKEAVGERRGQLEQEAALMKIAKGVGEAGLAAEQGGKGLDALVRGAQSAVEPPMPVGNSPQGRPLTPVGR